MNKCECIKEIQLDCLGIHPSILKILKLEHLDYLMQDQMTVQSYKSEALNLIHVVKKKGTRGSSKYLVVRGMGTYFAHERLFDLGERSVARVIEVDDSISDERVQEMFLFECFAFKRTAGANAATAILFKGVSDARYKKRQPTLFEPNIKDVNHARAKTLRQITGYDGRAFQNALKNENPPESLITAIKEWK